MLLTVGGVLLTGGGGLLTGGGVLPTVGGVLRDGQRRAAVAGERRLPAVLDAIARGCFGSAAAYLPRADTLVAIAAVFDALALHHLVCATVFDALAAILERLAGAGTTFGLQHRAFSLETLAATQTALAAFFFARAPYLLALARALLADTARFLHLAGALDRFTRTTFAGGLRARLCRENQDGKSREQRGTLRRSEHVRFLLASFDAPRRRLVSADGHLTAAGDCHALAPAYVSPSVA